MKLSTQILLAFCIVLALSVIDTISNYVLSVKVQRNTEFLNKSQEIIRISGQLHKEIIRQQSAFRGFLLTQDTGFLRDYKSGLNTIPELLVEQRSLVEGNREELALLDSIEKLQKNWLEYANSLLIARQSVEYNEEAELEYEFLFNTRLRRQIGKKLNDQISEKFLEFDRTEYRTRELRSGNLIASIRRTHIFSFTFLALTVIVGIVSTAYIVFIITRRIKTMVRLADDISKGRFTTVKDDRHDELTSLSESLNIMSDNLNRNINELEKRNAELDNFAYVVSHDLKAPIRGIHNVVTWIEEDLGKEISPQMKKYLEIIPQRTRRMENLINGLLEYARIREKTMPEETDVNELVSEIVETVVPRGFTVDTQNLPVTVTERLKLEQVFTNLISNAVKYTPSDDGRILISCREIPGYYEFSVRDNGIGIEPEYHERIFGLFQTLRERDEKESTGIGLAIIKKIIEDQRGSIWVNSSLGNGAEFVFTWPRLNLN